MRQFQRKHGPFGKLKQVLEVDGLGVKVLDRLCESILKNSSPILDHNESESQIATHVKSVTKRSKIQLVTPPISNDQVLVSSNSICMR